MNKEIVVAAHNEIINWIPKHWKNITTIYRCGAPENNITNKIQNRNRHHDQNDFYGKIDQLRELYYLFKEVTEIFQENPTSYAPNILTKTKNTENCPKLRESNQWLNHITSRYNCLADITFFLQGCPFDHCKEIINLVDSIQNVSFSCLPYKDAGKNNESMVNNFWEKINDGVVPEKVCWAAGAQFVAHKKTILSKPIEWYKKIQQEGLKTDRSGEILERTWWNVLGEPEITKL
jgi:hypothetical protein